MRWIVIKTKHIPVHLHTAYGSQAHHTRQMKKMVMTTRMMTINPPPTAPAIIAIITLPPPASTERESSLFKSQVSFKHCESCWTHLLALLVLTFPPPPPVPLQSPQQLPQTVPLPPPLPSWTCQKTDHSPQRSTPCSRQCPGRRGAAKRHSWLPS